MILTLLTQNGIDINIFNRSTVAEPPSTIIESMHRMIWKMNNIYDLLFSSIRYEKILFPTKALVTLSISVSVRIDACNGPCWFIPAQPTPSFSDIPILKHWP